MNGTRQVVLLVPFSFLVYVIGTSDKSGSVQVPDAKQLAAWAVLLLILLLFADLGETGTIAAALAWLIALTVFLTYGTALVDRVTKWVE